MRGDLDLQSQASKIMIPSLSSSRCNLLFGLLGNYRCVRVISIFQGVNLWLLEVCVGLARSPNDQLLVIELLVHGEGLMRRSEP
jgi:hypothetical protein